VTNITYYSMNYVTQLLLFFSYKDSYCPCGAFVSAVIIDIEIIIRDNEKSPRIGLIFDNFGFQFLLSISLANFLALFRSSSFGWPQLTNKNLPLQR